MVGLITRKLGMISIIDANSGRLVPITLLLAPPATISHIKKTATDGYSAYQILGHFFNQKTAKPQIGQAKRAGIINPDGIRREFRLKNDADLDGLETGQVITVAEFAVGDPVEVVAVSRGKGFAGTIKRHNFHRQPMTHGAKKGRPRSLGSIGSMYPQKVMKGKKMPGRMGRQRVTLTGLRIGLVDSDNDVIGIVGGLPGPRRGLILVRGRQNKLTPADQPPTQKAEAIE